MGVTLLLTDKNWKLSQSNKILPIQRLPHDFFNRVV